MEMTVPAQKKTAASTKPLWQKLFIKGGTVLLANAPAGYDKVLDGSPAKVTTRASGTPENVLLFANDEAGLEKSLTTLAGRLTPATNLWIAYRKGGKTLHRDTLWKHGEAFGLTGVSLVAVDDSWSAMRFRKS